MKKLRPHLIFGILHGLVMSVAFDIVGAPGWSAYVFIPFGVMAWTLGYTNWGKSNLP